MHAATYAKGTQIVGAKMTSPVLQFFAGETSRAPSLSLTFATENKKVYLSHFVLMKKFELDL